MNKTKIEWTDFSWNPVTGCKHGCWYCYAKRMVTQGRVKYESNFDPAFHPSVLDAPLKGVANDFRSKNLALPDGSAMIFTVSMGDLLGGWVPPDWIHDVIEVIRSCPRHKFQLLTKNPGRYKEFDWPENAWLGVTIDFDQRWADRWDSMLHLINTVRFISFEPLLGHHPEGLGMIFDCPPEWVIVGAMTGAGAVPPRKEWVEDIIRRADEVKVPVFLKDNLLKLYPDLPKRQEWPRC